MLQFVINILVVDIRLVFPIIYDHVLDHCFYYDRQINIIYIYIHGLTNSTINHYYCHSYWTITITINITIKQSNNGLLMFIIYLNSTVI